MKNLSFYSFLIITQKYTKQIINNCRIKFIFESVNYWTLFNFPLRTWKHSVLSVLMELLVAARRFNIPHPVCSLLKCLRVAFIYVNSKLDWSLLIFRLNQFLFMNSRWKHDIAVTITKLKSYVKMTYFATAFLKDYTCLRTVACGGVLGNGSNEQSSFFNLSFTLPTSQLILQPFHRFTYVTAHSQILPLLYLRHSSFSNPSFASPASQALHLIHLESRPWFFHAPSNQCNLLFIFCFFSKRNN